MQFFLPTILLAFPSHTSDSCREVFFDILMYVWENFAELRKMPELVLNLLKGLADTNEVRVHAVLLLSCR